MFQPRSSVVVALTISYYTVLWDVKNTQEHYLICILVYPTLLPSFFSFLKNVVFLLWFSDWTWWLVLPDRKRVSDQCSSIQFSLWVQVHWVIVWVATSENIINGYNFFKCSFLIFFLAPGLVYFSFLLLWTFPLTFPNWKTELISFLMYFLSTLFSIHHIKIKKIITQNFKAKRTIYFFWNMNTYSFILWLLLTIRNE